MGGEEVVGCLCVWWWREGGGDPSGVEPQPAKFILILVGNYTFKLYPEVKSCSHLINLNSTRPA